VGGVAEKDTVQPINIISHWQYFAACSFIAEFTNVFGLPFTRKPVT
jgi:hypothetical protein